MIIAEGEEGVKKFMKIALKQLSDLTVLVRTGLTR